jgi:TonB family protein
MKKLILPILCVVAITTSAQEKLKKVEIKDNEKNTTEIYFVKKTDNQIKQGEYTLFGYGKSLHVSGYYNANRRTGIWKYYNNGGKPSLEFDFDKDSLIRSDWQKTDTTVFKVKVGNRWIKKEVSSPPFPLYSDLLFMINQNLRYPVKAAEKGIMGKVVIAVHIDDAGKVLGYRIDKKQDELLNEESLRVVKLITEWYPAICEGKKVECEYMIPITFKLD